MRELQTEIEINPSLGRFWRPGPPLSEFVDFFWFQESPAAGRPQERVLPIGTAALLFNLRDNTLRIFDRSRSGQCRNFSGPFICGPHSQFFAVDTTARATMLGVHFKSGGAFPFWGLPVNELRLGPFYSRISGLIRHHPHDIS